MIKKAAYFAMSLRYPQDLYRSMRSANPPWLFSSSYPSDFTGLYCFIWVKNNCNRRIFVYAHAITNAAKPYTFLAKL